MQMVRHDTTTCPGCDSLLWYGTKAEGNSWTVYYECTVCGFERRAGRVAMADVDDRDSVWDRAEALGEQF